MPYHNLSVKDQNMLQAICWNNLAAMDIADQFFANIVENRGSSQSRNSLTYERSIAWGLLGAEINAGRTRFDVISLHVDVKACLRAMQDQADRAAWKKMDTTPKSPWSQIDDDGKCANTQVLFGRKPTAKVSLWTQTSFSDTDEEDDDLAPVVTINIKSRPTLGHAQLWIASAIEHTRRAELRATAKLLRLVQGGYQPTLAAIAE